VPGGEQWGSEADVSEVGITECSGLEETSVGHLVQPLCESRVTQSRLQRTLSRWVLNISREGERERKKGLAAGEI